MSVNSQLKKARTYFIAGFLLINIILAQGISLAENSPDTSLLDNFESRRQELRDLKKNDPEAFKQRIAELRQEANVKLNQLESTNPEEFDRIVSQRKSRIRARIERLRAEDPERYESIMQMRQEKRQKRMEWMRKNNPGMHAQMQKIHEFREANPDISRGEIRQRFNLPSRQERRRVMMEMPKELRPGFNGLKRGGSQHLGQKRLRQRDQ